MEQSSGLNALILKYNFKNELMEQVTIYFFKFQIYFKLN